MVTIDNWSSPQITILFSLFWVTLPKRPNKGPKKNIMLHRGGEGKGGGSNDTLNSDYVIYGWLLMAMITLDHPLVNVNTILKATEFFSQDDVRHGEENVGPKNCLVSRQPCLHRCPHHSAGQRSRGLHPTNHHSDMGGGGAS